MKYILIAILIASAPCCLYAQPSQAELNKMMQDAKEMMKQFGFDGNTEVSVSGKPGRFPARQTKLLNSLPKKVLTAAELKIFTGTLYTDLQKKLPAAKVKSANTIIQKLGTNYDKIAAAGVTAWYKNSPAEAALLTTYASSKSTNPNTLNNCGAILTLCGLEAKAIPVLKHVLQLQPGSSTVLNNIGQTYAGLGATDTAMVYIMGCMLKVSNHPEACATAAYIEMERGNIEKAVEYAEKALRSSYNESLAELYRKNRKTGDLWKLYKDKMPKKNYFDMHDLVIPPNTKSWEQTTQLYPKQDAYLKKLEELGKVVGKETVGDAPMNSTNPADYIKWSQTLTGPKGCFAAMALAIRNDMGDWYLEERNVASLDMMTKMRELGIKQGNIAIAFEEKWGKLTHNAKGEQLTRLLEQKCRERIQLDNTAFAERALLVEKFKNEWFPRDVEYFNNYVFLATLINPNEARLKMDYANVKRHMLGCLKTYLAIVINPNGKPNCGNYEKPEDGNAGSPLFKDADCPIDIEIPFVIGKINLDCKQFGIEAGEGIIINYQKDFISRNSTLAIGLGAGVSIPGAGFLGEQSPFEAGAKGQFYVTFDGNNQPVDGGMLWEAGAGIPGVTGTSMGYTLGVNSGFTFDTGPLSGLLQ